jgi:hypothetical protein
MELKEGNCKERKHIENEGNQKQCEDNINKET